MSDLQVSALTMCPSGERASLELPLSAGDQISHSTGTLRDYCDLGAVLHNGQLTLYDSLQDAVTQHEKNQNS